MNEGKKERKGEIKRPREESMKSVMNKEREKMRK